jgi:endonuclease/exonuclease/phosphatase family metal-dependent hydrolase
VVDFRGMRGRLIAFVLVLAALAASVAGAATAKPKPKPKPKPPVVKVFTQNLYVGFDVQTLLDLPPGASTAQFVAATTAAYQTVQASDPVGRMQAVANEIAAYKPDLVGLQEAATYQSASNGSYDFAGLIRSDLAKQGLTYAVVADSKNTNVAVPINGGGDFVNFADHDVLLARTGKGAKKLTITHKRTGHYADQTIVNTPLGQVPFPRGWDSADVKVAGRSFHVVNTHLEAFNDARQGAQAHELISGPAASKLPTLVMGDLNSNANAGFNNTETVPDLLQAGFKDLWAIVHPGDPGLTCCEDASLRNETPELKQRVDLVLGRGSFTPLAAAVVGRNPPVRTAGGLWPSDHAGVEMTLRVSR